MRLTWVLVTFAQCLLQDATFANSFFEWDGEVNRRPAHFLVDTGWGIENVVLSKAGANRLGLTLRPQDGLEQKLVVRWKAQCSLNLFHWEGSKSMLLDGEADVVDFVDPKNAIDGLVGWPLISQRITRFDALTGKFEFLRKVPREASEWMKFKIRKRDGLAVEIPSNDGNNKVVLIDTGNHGRDCVFLSPQLWESWSASHSHLNTFFDWASAAGGPVIMLVVRADRYSLGGGLEMTNIILCNYSDLGASNGLPDADALISFDALRRFVFIADGQSGMTYFRSVPLNTAAHEAPASRYRGGGGAVFAPGNPHATNLMAHVIDDSPAFMAGVRNGDILLKLDDYDVAQWLAHPETNWTVDFGTPLPTLSATSTNNPSKIELIIRRMDRTIQATVPRRTIMICPSRRTPGWKPWMEIPSKNERTKLGS
jgi:hypothetical protein